MLMVADGGDRAEDPHSLPRLVASERVWSPELSEGGLVLPTLSEGFWPQQVLGGDGQQQSSGGGGKQHPLIKVGRREALNSSPKANFRGRGYNLSFGQG